MTYFIAMQVSDLTGF